MKESIHSLDIYKIYVYAFVAASIFIYTTHIYWMFSQEYPLDWDSFYYLTQIKNYRLNGVGYFNRTGSLYVFSSIGSFFNLADTEIFYCFVAFAHTLLIIALYFLGASCGTKTIGVLSACWPLASQTLFLDTFSHPRQTLSVGLVILATSFLQKRAPSLWSSILGISIFTLGVFTHGFGALLAFCYIIGSLFYRNHLGSKPLKFFLFFLPLLSIGLITVPKRFFEFYPHLETPWSFMQKNLNYGGNGKIEFFLMLVGVLVGILCWFRSREKMRYLPVILFIACCILPIWDPKGTVGVRLITSSYWPVLFLLLLISIQVRFRGEIQLFLTTVALSVLSISVIYPDMPIVNATKFAPKLLAQNSQLIRGWLGDDPYVLAPLGVHYQVAYFLGAPSWRAKPKRQYNRNFILSPSNSSLCESVDSLTQGQDPACIDIGEGWKILKQN